MHRAVIVSCLGPVRLSVARQEVRLGADQQVLLAILAAAGEQGLTKGQLYERLFANNPQKSREQTAVMRVQRLRAKISDLADGVRAITSGQRYALDAGHCEVDLWSFEQALSSDDIPEIHQALELWQEPFQALVEDPDCVVVAREALRLRRRTALARFEGDERTRCEP